jgi:CheY-like chemotaxis protein
MDAPCPQASLHTLIIDDDQLVRDFAVHTVEFGTNRKATTFESGFHAWQYVQSHPDRVDIVIADVNIPDMDGLELLERIKRTFPQKVFIVTSSDPANEQTAYQLGADAFLAKPYDVNDLLTLVQALMLTGGPPMAQKSIPLHSQNKNAPRAHTPQASDGGGDPG